MVKQTVVSVNGKKTAYLNEKITKVDKSKYVGYKNPPILNSSVVSVNSKSVCRDSKRNRRINMSFNFSRANFSTSPFSAAQEASAPQTQQGVDSFEAQCGEGEHILAIQLNPAKHWQMEQGSYKADFRQSTWLTFTAGSIMTSEQNGPFAKGLILVGLYLYKKGVYLQPPAYTSDGQGNWGLHPEASLSGLAKLIYGEFAEETAELLATYSAKIDEIVALAKLAENAVQLIDQVEGCIDTGDFSSLANVTAENATEYLQWIEGQQSYFNANQSALQEEYDNCVAYCKQLTELRKDTQFWRYLCSNTQTSVNLTGISNDNIRNTFESLREDSKAEGRILKMRCILSTSIGFTENGPTVELRIQALACKIEKGQLGKAVIGKLITQTDSTRKLAASDKLLEEQSAAFKLQQADMKMKSWTNTATHGNKSMQAFNEFKQSAQGGGKAKTKKGNADRVVERATQKEQELLDAIALLRKLSPNSPEIASLETQLASVRARIAQLKGESTPEQSEKKAQEEAAAKLPPVEEEEEYDPNAVYSSDDTI
jgi:hypothetical protein